MQQCSFAQWATGTNTSAFLSIECEIECRGKFAKERANSVRILLCLIVFGVLCDSQCMHELHVHMRIESERVIQIAHVI